MKISNENFYEIVSSLKEINSKDIYYDIEHSSFTDGYYCTLEFSSTKKDNLVIYKVQCPNNDTKKRNLVQYLKACRLIIKLAGLEKKVCAINH